MVAVIRLGALALGLSCTGLGAFGAYEFTRKLEGEVTYLVLAAPLIAVAAAFIPPIAEATWRSGHPLKATLWWLVLVPAGAVVSSPLPSGSTSLRPVRKQSAMPFGAPRLAPKQHSPGPRRTLPRREPRRA
jgi:hypothetical protein